MRPSKRVRIGVRCAPKKNAKCFDGCKVRILESMPDASKRARLGARAPKAPHAHARQNGAAKAKAAHGPPAAAGSAVLRARLAAAEEARRADNVAIKAAETKAEREADKVRQEQRRQLDRQLQDARKKPGFFHAQW
jgi:hypothetical protein